ncbi:hypothetical protein E2320_003126, partial [Naja naja]
MEGLAVMVSWGWLLGPGMDKRPRRPDCMAWGVQVFKEKDKREVRHFAGLSQRAVFFPAAEDWVPGRLAGDLVTGPGTTFLCTMQNGLGPACIFLRKNIADKQREFDKDKDGYISCKDLGNLMRTMGYMPTEMELIELSQQINMNLGGHVAFDDFVELMTPKLLAETAGMIGLQEMRDVFKEFDTNGDGKITLTELRQTMQRLMSETMSPQEINDMVKDADVNGDGTVDFEGDWNSIAIFPHPEQIFEVLMTK